MSRIAILLALAAILAIAAPLLAGPESATSHPPSVAIVCRVEGKATLRPAPGAPPESLALFRRLPLGAILTAAPRSTVTVVFFDGQRYALQPEARAVVEAAGLRVTAGRVRRLPAVPEVVDLAPVLRDAAAKRRVTAVRIRGEPPSEGAVSGLVPREGAPVRRAAALTLSFTPLPGVEVYHLVVEDETGRAAFTRDIQAPRVQLPPGLLRPGTLYYWWVEPKVPPHPEMRGEAFFNTLDEKTERARGALSAAASRAGETDLALLLAAVDDSLGLRREACAELAGAAGGQVLRPNPAFDCPVEPTGPAALPGIVVEQVPPRSLGARVGLHPGDVLLRWCRSEAASPLRCVAEGRIDSPFDLAAMEAEEIPRGGVRLVGRRGSEDATWDLLPGPLGLEVRPMLPPALLRLYPADLTLGAGGAEGAAERWRAAATAQPLGGRLYLWFLWRAASASNRAGRGEEANARFAAALAEARQNGDTSAEARLSLEWARALKSSKATEAEELYHRALEIYRDLGQKDLAVAQVLHDRCVRAADRGDLDAAESACRQALTIWERQAPHSLTLSATLDVLSNVALERGGLQAAEGYLQRAAALDADIAPGSLSSVWNLYYSSKLAIMRSDFATAHDLLRRAKTILEEAEPHGLRIAEVLNGLGVVAASHGDPEAAEDFFRRSLAIRERADPGDPGIAIGFQNLAALAANERGDLETAEPYLRRALELDERKAPGGPVVATDLYNLGNLERQRGHAAEARDLLERALGMWERINPQSLDTARILNLLGTLSADAGHPKAAKGYFRRALAIEGKLAPGTSTLADTLYNFGRLERLQHSFRPAAAFFCQAVETLESQRGKLGIADTSSFGPTIMDAYAGCLGAHLQTGERAEAFRILERGRARAFLEQLAARDLLAASELPLELASRRKQLHDAYDVAQSELANLEPARDAVRIEDLHRRLREIRSLQDDLAGQIRRESPRYASLHDPATLDLAGARRTLDPGTVLLAYTVDEEKTYLLVVQPAQSHGKGLATFILPVGQKALRRAVRSFRALVQDPGSDLRVVTAHARKLYDLLLGPAESQIAGAARLLVSPDGPLYTLPFAALLRKGRYLAEWKPIHSVLSATVYAELRRARRPPGDLAALRLVAFGDPAYPRLRQEREAEPAAAPEVLRAVRRGLSLEPLPASRAEVSSIASLFPQARTYLGSEATEEQAKATGPQARFLHFACHGLLDERSPLDSALALSIPEHPAPGQDNGLLQAWEIFESLRLDADLVTLSACDSGLGKEMGGEGLIGLTRAFQYAGARSVLASLWSVADASTAELMRRFYGYLQQGKSKDEALRLAQVDLIRSPDERFSHPFYWAAFQLHGDFK